MRCVRSRLQCVSRLRSFRCHQVRSKREGISLSRRDLPVISALVAIRHMQVVKVAPVPAQGAVLLDTQLISVSNHPHS